MNKAGTIILPVAGRSSRFPGLRPKWMLTSPAGELMVVLSLKSIPDWRDHRVVVGALREHLEEFGGRTALNIALGDAAEIVTFDEQTGGPAVTVASMLRKANVEGPIFVKDCDSWFQPSEDIFCDCVCFADLHKLRDVRNVAGKSFVHTNENKIVTNIKEKNVSSNFISVGGYGFQDASVYLKAFDNLAREASGEPFISHVIIEAMHGGAVFKAVETVGYQDVGTLEAWEKFRQGSGVFLVDLDGVLLRNAGEFVPPLWKEQDVALPKNVEIIRKLSERGAQIILITARPEQYREKTESFLASLGLKWHAAIFGVSHAARTLINDFAGSNPYPSATAINLMRNDDALDRFLRLDID